MSRPRKSCTRPCKYHSCPERGGGCDYLGMTGKSRLKAVYDTLGVERLSADRLQREPLLRPKNCPVYEKRPRGFVKQGPKNICLRGSRPKTADKPRKAHNKGVYSFDTVQAMRLYQEGLNDVQIAERVGARRSNIYWWRKVNGLKANFQVHMQTFSEEEARRLYEAGLSDSKIGQALGVTTQSIYKWRKRRDLPTKQGGKNT